MAPINWLKVPPPHTLLPRRLDGHLVAPKAFSREFLLGLIDEYRETICDAFGTSADAFERGLGRSNEDMQRVVREAIANLRSTRAPLTLHPLTEGAVAALVGAEFDVPVVPYWIACAGLAFAVRAMCAWADLSVKNDRSSGQAVAWIVPRPKASRAGEPCDPAYDDGPWMQLRRAVAESDEATYEEARQRAAKLREGGSFAVRCGLAFAFPAEPEWAKDEAFLEVQCLPKDTRVQIPHALFALLASLRDAPLAERICQAAVTYNCAEWASPYVWELVANLGWRATKPLEILAAGPALTRVRKVVRAHALGE